MREREREREGMWVLTPEQAIANTGIHYIASRGFWNMNEIYRRCTRKESDCEINIIDENY